MSVCSPQRRAGWLSFAGSLMMALPLLAGEASAQTVPKVFWILNTRGLIEDPQRPRKGPEFNLTRSLSADLTISYTIGGTATGGVDYRIAGANYSAGTGTFTVPSGTQAWTDVALPVVEVINDSVSDNGETIILTFTDGAGYDLGTVTTMVLTIYEDSGHATFRIRGVPRVGETLTTERISSDPDGDGTFSSHTWQQVDDPVRNADMWRLISSNFSFPPEPLVLPRAYEGRYIRSLWVYVDGNGLEHTIYTDPFGPILPLETPEVFFDSTSARVAEGVGTHHVVVRLRSAPASDLTLNYSVGGSATAGSDFTISNLGTVEVPAGAISVSIPVSIMEDRMEERRETVILTLEDGEGYLVDSSATTHTLTVIDGVEVGWGTTSVSAVEGEGRRNLALQVNQRRSTPLTVSYTLGGTATPGEDYRIAGANTTTRSGTFTIPAGTPAFTTVDFPIEIMGDSVPDNGETIVITITAGSDYNPGPGAMATVGIHEESGSAAFRVSGLPRVGDVLMVERTASDPEGEVTLSYQWQRKENLNPGAWQGISGATASTYTPSSADGGKYVRVAVVYTDGNGLPYTIPTDPLGPIIPAGTATASFASASATVAEGVGTHQVVVNLSPPAASALTLNYSVRGTATAGSDFTISNLGTVQVAEGAASVSIPVSIIHDQGEESNETVVLTLEAGMGYMVTSSTTPHTLTITDSPAPGDGEDHRDHKRVKKAWHLRLGRTLSHQVADGLQDRLSVPPAAGLQLTVAGEAITSAVPLAEQEGLLTKALGFEAVTSQALAAGSSFRVASGQAAEGAAPRLAFWGQGAFSSFSGEEEDLSLDGEVTTLLLGADWTSQRWRAGAALSQSWGSGSYDGDNSAEGEISTTVTGVFPYGRYALTPRLGIWATAGYGWGELSFQPDGEDEFTPSTTMSMAAVGMDGLVRDGGSDGISLTTTADLLMVKTHSEEVDGLDSSEGSLSRLRLGLEAVRPFPLSDGASLLPTMALGIRQDDGDAETGFGLELGAGLLWMAPERGLSGALQGHTLLTHGEEDLQEQGLAFSFSWEPSPSNRGPSLSLNHTMGATPSPGMDARNPTTHTNSGQQFEAELAYGLPAHSDRLSLTPAVALALSPTSRTYSLLWSLAPYAQQAHPDPWQLSLAGERQEHNTATSPMDHSLKLRFSTLF